MTEIPAFTPEDFATAKPYQWLYEQRQDPFEAKLAEASLKVQAAAAGCRNFVATYNAYVKAQAARGRVQLEAVTEFDRQPVVLACGPYTCNEDGVHLTTSSGEDITVCPHHGIIFADTRFFISSA